MLDATPLIERETQLASLRRWVETARDAQGGVVLLSGEAGIGKTRLTQELIVLASLDGWRIVNGACRDDPGAPAYWPWISGLRDYVDSILDDTMIAQLGSDASHLVQLFPSLRTRVGVEEESAELEPEQARFLLFDSVSRLLRLMALDQPLLLVLDDLHWADRSSLLLLEFVAAELADLPLLIAGTFRDLEVTRAHPFSDTLGGLSKLPRIEQIRVRRLSVDGVRQLLTQAVGAAPADALSVAIHQQTDGNPFFTREVIELLGSEGHLDGASGAEALAAAIPDSVRGAIGRRLNRLSAGCGEMLSLAAVLGQDFELRAVQAAGGYDGQLDDWVREASAAGMLIAPVAVHGRYRFAHPLIREVLYDELGDISRARLHQRAGEALERLHSVDRDPHLNELAHHFQEAAARGVSEKAFDYLRRAAERSVTQFAWADAIDQFRAAQSHGPDLEDAQRIEILIGLGEAQVFSGQEEAGVETLRKAMDDAASADLPALAARAALRYAEWGIYASAGFAAASIIPRVEAVVRGLGEGEVVLRGRLLSAIAFGIPYLPDDAALANEGIRLSEEAAEIAREADDAFALSNALRALYGAAWQPELIQQRMDVATELLQIAQTTDNRPQQVLGYRLSIACLLEQGEVERGAEMVAASATLIEALHSDRLLALIELRQAWFAALRGEFATAEDHARRAMLPGVPVTMIYGATLLACIGRAQGRLAELQRDVVAPLQGAPADGGSAQVVLALTALALGDQRSASSRFEKLAAAGFEGVERDWDRLPSFAGLAEFCVATGDRERAETLYSLLEPYQGRNPAGYSGVYGSSFRQLGLLARLLGRNDEAASHYEAALEFNTRMRARPWLAWTQADYAALLIERDGADGSARVDELLRESRKTADELRMAPLIDRLDELDQRFRPAPTQRHPDGLTRREVDVLRLIAHGQNNAEIAAELVLSVRTIERHITNLYAKIDARGRADAATYALRHELIDPLEGRPLAD